jgi:hypothetical protein
MTGGLPFAELKQNNFRPGREQKAEQQSSAVYMGLSSDATAENPLPRIGRFD